jgi:hypothetical protein
MYKYQTFHMMSSGPQGGLADSGDMISPFDVIENVFNRIEKPNEQTDDEFVSENTLSLREIEWHSLCDTNLLKSSNIEQSSLQVDSCQLASVPPTPNAMLEPDSGSGTSESSIDESEENDVSDETSEDQSSVTSLSTRRNEKIFKPQIGKCPVSDRMGQKGRKTPDRMTKAQMHLLAPSLRRELSLIDDKKSTIAESVASLKEDFPELAKYIKPALLTKCRRGQIMNEYTGRVRVADVPRAQPKATKRGPRTQMELQRTIMRRAAQGESVGDLANEYGINRCRIYHWINR